MWKYCDKISQVYLFYFIFSSLFIFPSIHLFFFFSFSSSTHYFSSLSSFFLFIFYLLVYLYLQVSPSFIWTKNTKTCHSSSHHIEGKSPLCPTKGGKNSLCPLSSIFEYCGSDSFKKFDMILLVLWERLCFMIRLCFCIVFGVFVAIEVEINAEILVC